MNYKNIVKGFKKTIAQCDKREAQLDKKVGKLLDQSINIQAKANQDVANIRSASEAMVEKIRSKVRNSDSEISVINTLRNNMKALVGESK